MNCPAPSCRRCAVILPSTATRAVIVPSTRAVDVLRTAIGKRPFGNAGLQEGFLLVLSPAFSSRRRALPSLCRRAVITCCHRMCRQHAVVPSSCRRGVPSSYVPPLCRRCAGMMSCRHRAAVVQPSFYRMSHVSDECHRRRRITSGVLYHSGRDIGLYG